MNLILFPTDFSGYSENAFQYILNFADRLRAKIIFQFVITPGETSVKQSATDSNAHLEALHLIHELKFRSAEFAFQNNCSIVTDHIITEGDICEEILKAAMTVKPLVIALSTELGTPDNRQHTGNVTSSLLRRSKHPVLVIPEDARYNKINHIALATDLTDKDEALIYKLMITAALFDAKLHVFNIASKKETGIVHVVEYLKMVFKYPLQVEKLSFETIQVKSIATGIDRYIREHTVDLLCMEHHHSFLSELFDIKKSDRKLFHHQVPTLIYYEQ